MLAPFGSMCPCEGTPGRDSAPASETGPAEAAKVAAKVEVVEDKGGQGEECRCVIIIHISQNKPHSYHTHMYVHIYVYNICLVVSNMTFIFHFIYGVSAFPTDELIFFRGVGRPPAR